jgi:hypothetical protein
MESFNERRKKYYNKNVDNIESEEYKYVNIQNLKHENCDKLRQTYINTCDNVRFVADIKQFYDSNWFYTYQSKIQNIQDYSTLKDLMIQLKVFKTILKIKEIDDITIVIPDVEQKLKKCISSRIKYKYLCVKPEHRNKQHDKEILRNIFHDERYHELKTLFVQMQKKFLELKTEKLKQRRKEDEQRRKDDELELEYLEIIGTSSSGSFTPVVKKSRRSRKKRH